MGHRARRSPADTAATCGSPCACSVHAQCVSRADAAGQSAGATAGRHDVRASAVYALHESNVAQIALARWAARCASRFEQAFGTAHQIVRRTSRWRQDDAIHASADVRLRSAPPIRPHPGDGSCTAIPCAGRYAAGCLAIDLYRPGPPTPASLTMHARRFQINTFQAGNHAGAPKLPTVSNVRTVSAVAVSRRADSSGRSLPSAIDPDGSASTPDRQSLGRCAARRLLSSRLREMAF